MNLEPLEARSLFNVTVTEGYPGFYEIHGTNGDDVIIAQINMAEQTLDVDGQTYTDVQYVVAYGYAGEDFITIASLDGAGIIGAGIVAGPGDDLALLGVDGALFAGPGNDRIYLFDSFRGQAYGESGNDFVDISSACVDAEVYGGEGHDYIDCAANFYGVVAFGGTGNDTIYGSAHDDQLFGGDGQDVIDAGAGADTVYGSGGDWDDVYGGDGYDIAYVDHSDSVGSDIESVYYS